MRRSESLIGILYRCQPPPPSSRVLHLLVPISFNVRSLLLLLLLPSSTNKARLLGRDTAWQCPPASSQCNQARGYGVAYQDANGTGVALQRRPLLLRPRQLPRPQHQQRPKLQLLLLLLLAVLEETVGMMGHHRRRVEVGKLYRDACLH